MSADGLFAGGRPTARGGTMMTPLDRSRTMPRRRLWLVPAVALVAAMVGVPIAPRAVATTLPAALDDQEFWRLSSTLSEESGQFHSENFVSNEAEFQLVIPDLVRRVRPAGVYLGVGPEQNFTYIAAVRPALAFIIDIRSGNLHGHLLYKALFEMSATRLEFLSRLFVRQMPAGIDVDAPVESLFAALEASPPDEARFQTLLAEVLNWLTERRRLPLDAATREGIGYVYRAAFLADGPALNYRLTGQGGFRAGNTPTYAELMSFDDGTGRQRSYLATEELFQWVRGLQQRNLIVPVVGDFGGSRALQGVGRYLREHDAVVSTFYLSNVEQYLRPAGKWAAFCANVAALPLDPTSTFIRSLRGGRSALGFIRFASSLGWMREETSACVAEGRAP
jgi:hypothetical protein